MYYQLCGVWLRYCFPLVFIAGTPHSPPGAWKEPTLTTSTSTVESNSLHTQRLYTHTLYIYDYIYIYNYRCILYFIFVYIYLLYIYFLYIYIIYTCYIHIHYSMHQNMYTIYGYSSLSFQHICKNKRDDEHQSFCWWELFEQTYLPRPVTLSALLVLTAAGNLRSVGWWETLKLNPGGLTFMIIGILVGDF